MRPMAPLLMVLLAMVLAAAQSSQPAQNAPYGTSAGAHQQTATAANPLGNFTPPQPPPPPDNSAMEAHIDSALRSEPSLNGGHVSARVTNDTIELTGSVASNADKTTAERIALSFDGNRKLNDKLVVTGAQLAASQAQKPTSPRK